MSNSRNNAQLILNTSANLLGFCLVVITSLHISNFTTGHYVDEITLFVAFFLTVSNVLSFYAIRQNNERKRALAEKWCELFFMVSLIGILIAISLITLNFIH
ncbi:MAG: hypothetical protein RIQ47_611 [Bacteroidota bacterium]|jgi:hypothetical protein